MSELSQPTSGEMMNDDPWDEYLQWTRRITEWEGFDESERNYKLVIGERLVAARSALLESSSEWIEQLHKAFGAPNNLTDWRFNGPFLDWCEVNPRQAERALRMIWDEDRTVRERFNDLVASAADGAVRINVTAASFLHMGMGPTTYPIFRATPVSDAYKLTGYADPYGRSNADTGGRYEHFLNFLDLSLELAARHGVNLRDRLDAQSVAWWISSRELPPNATAEEIDALNRYRNPSNEAAPEEPSAPPADEVPPEVGNNVINYEPPSFPDIVRRINEVGLRSSDRTLRRYHLSLLTRGFVILAGNSGTGKTWLAEAYAHAVGAEHLVVAVAPNWTTNEDLLGYFNPVSSTYHHTSFSQFIGCAANAYRLATANGLIPRPFHLILDEMNLARVEYYFASFLSAMEVRARHGTALIDIGAGDTLELTPNLCVTGTVNIDETTHGFADKVWDRAQLVELDLPREHMQAHLGDSPYSQDLLDIWGTVESVGPFAYRVVDEISAYVSAAEHEGASWQEAVDEQILQKILPKLKGAEPGVSLALERLVSIFGERYPLSKARAERMLEGFQQYGFASYFH